MKFIRSLFLLTLLFPLKMFSQTTSPVDSDLSKLFEKSKAGIEGLTSAASFEKIPLERAVNPVTYICGAGDVISLNIVMPYNAQITLPISTDGIFSIPRVGAVQLQGKTLKNAEKEILSSLNRRYPNAQASISLYRPRFIYVTVTGDVENPGLYTITSATPVSVAINLANTKDDKAVTSTQPFKPTEQKPKGYYTNLSKQFFGDNLRTHRSYRHIYIQRSSGVVESVDLVKYYATRDEKYNPLLREGDEIVVPVRDIAAPTIGVYGAINKPCEYEYVVGDDIATLIKLGLGLNQELHPTSAELVRQSKDGLDEKIQINIDGIENNTTALLPGDRIIIKGNPVRASTGKVAVKGEVITTGVFPIAPGKTLLSEVMKMTGGFTPDAYPAMSEMYRMQINSDGTPIDLDREYARNLHLSLLTLEDTLSYRLESRLREGFVSVDFYKLFELHDQSADVPLFDGDVIIVPRNTMTVQVLGMVANGGYMPWKKDASLDYYIKRANGYLEDASKSRVRIIKANTRAWLDPDDTSIEPGDIIWVHRNPQVRASNTVEVLGVIASVVAGVAGITSLAIQVLRK